MPHTMTNAESLNFIAAIGAAVATALAALAAFRSARSAESAQRALVEEQLRSGRRDVASLVSACSYEYSRIKFLAHTLNVIDRANAIFAGGVGGSRQKLAGDGVTTRLANAESLFKSASGFRDNPIAIGKLVQEDIDRLQVDLTISLADLRAIAEELHRDSSSREAQMLQHRERAIMSGQK